MILAPLADCCPECFPGSRPATAPYAVLADPVGILRASYRCPVCGTRWRTWRDRSPWPMFTAVEPAAVAEIPRARTPLEAAGREAA